MDFKKFDKKLSEKLKGKKLSPRPRWYFLLKNYLVWLFGACSLFIGSAAVALMLYFLKYSNLEIHKDLHKSLASLLLLTLPYFWIIFLAAFIFILYYNLKHTKHGYRYQIWKIVLTAVLLSIVLGNIFFIFGLGQKIDDILAEKAPLYSTVVNRQFGFWSNPREGRLTGLVSKKYNNQNFELIDSRGKKWQIIIQSGKFSCADLEIYQPINLLGQKVADNQFRAVMFRHIHPGRKFLLHRFGPNHSRIIQSQTNRPPRETKSHLIIPKINNFSGNSLEFRKIK